MSIKSIQCLLSHFSVFMTSAQCMALSGLYSKEIPDEIHNKTQKIYTKKGTRIHATVLAATGCMCNCIVPAYQEFIIIDLNCSHWHHDGNVQGAHLSQRGQMRDSANDLA